MSLSTTRQRPGKQRVPRLHISRVSRLNILWFLLAFWAGGLLRRVTDNFPFAQTTLVVYGGIIIAWCLTVRQRVLNRRTRGLLQMLSFGMLFLILMRAGKYLIFDELPDVQRIVFYLQSSCFTLLACLCALTALSIGEKGEGESGERLSRQALIAAVSGGFILLLLTNDLHHLFFSFPAGPALWYLEYTRGVLHIIHLVWIIFLLSLSLLTVLKKCRDSGEARFSWLFLVPMGIAAAYFLLFYLNGGNTNDFLWPHLFNPPEMICFVQVLFWEIAIQIGLIPCCTGYAEIFDLAPVPVFITREDGSVALRSRQAEVYTGEERELAREESLRVDPDTLLESRPISGGRIYWTDDLSDINSLNRALQESLLRLSEEETILTEQNLLKERQVRYEVQTRFYDSITRAVQPQMDAISRIISTPADTERRFRAQLRQLAVYGAFVKRRANLMLLAERAESLPLEELYLSLRESLDMLSLSGVKTRLVLQGTDRQGKTGLPSGLLIEVYDWFEALTEASMRTLDSVSAELRVGEKDCSIWLSFTPGLEAVPQAPAGSRLRPETLLNDREGTRVCFLLPLERGGE